MVVIISEEIQVPYTLFALGSWIKSHDGYFPLTADRDNSKNYINYKSLFLQSCITTEYVGIFACSQGAFVKNLSLCLIQVHQEKCQQKC